MKQRLDIKIREDLLEKKYLSIKSKILKEILKIN